MGSRGSCSWPWSLTGRFWSTGTAGFAVGVDHRISLKVRPGVMRSARTRDYPSGAEGNMGMHVGVGV